MRYKNLLLGFLILGGFLALNTSDQGSEKSATLVVNLSKFNYSDGPGSDEDRTYTRKQGLPLGQSHCTRERAGKVEYYIYLFPDNNLCREALRREEEGMRGMQDIDKVLPGGKLAGYDPFTLIMNEISYVYAFHSEPREGIEQGYWGIFELTPGENILPRIPPGEYFVIPAVKFHGRGIFGEGAGVYRLWIPAYYEERFVIETEGFFTGKKTKHIVTPILWAPEKINLTLGEITIIEIRPHPFNMSTKVDKFIRELILGE